MVPILILRHSTVLMMIADLLSLHIEIHWAEKKKIGLKQHHEYHNCQVYSAIFYNSSC